jgi:endonuclease-3 related protein
MNPKWDGYLHKLYQTLLKKYGPQGWWPLLSLEKFGINPPKRGTNTGYHPNNFDIPNTPGQILEVILGSILMQNTSWTNADKALGNLSAKCGLDCSTIMKLDHAELGEIIRSSGYYNQKASRLQGLCKFLKKHPISELLLQSVDELRPKLLQLDGVGPETADTIILYALKKPSFVIDAYTRRLLTRIGLVERKFSYDDYQHLFHQNFPPLTENISLFNEFHALIVQHCVYTCKKRPDCEKCILQSRCEKKIIVPAKKIKKSRSKDKYTPKISKTHR